MKSQRRAVYILIVAGLALRLAIAPWGGHPGDVATLARWAAAVGDHGYLAIYGASDANYPPLGMVVIAWSGWMYDLLAPGAASQPAGAVWLVALKLPSILADLGIGMLVWQLAWEKGNFAYNKIATWLGTLHERPVSRGDPGGRPGQAQGLPLQVVNNLFVHPSGALWLAASVVFNPALIYLSAWWGQLDSIYALFALAAVVAAIRGRSFWAGVWLGVGVMVKLQAVVIGPVVVLAALRTRPIGARYISPLRGIIRLALGAALPIASAMGPFVATGQAKLVARRVVALVAAPGWLTVNALNGWYLITGGAGNWLYNAPLNRPDNTTLIAGITVRMAGAAMLALWSASVLGLAALRERRGQTGSVWLLAGALLYLGVFLWPTQVHERYAFGAVVMLAGVVGSCLPVGANQRLGELKIDKPTPLVLTKVLWRRAALCGMITVLHTLNLVWAAPFATWLEGWFSGQRVAGLLIAAAMVGAALWGLWMLWSGEGSDTSDTTR